MNRCRLETIRAYWSGRVAAYSAVNADELGTIQAKVWDELIAEQLPWKHPLRILDAGCGPGFFSILMARRGHEITGVDYSEAMIECARENVENHSPEASAYFSQMDAQNLTFEDDTFDVVLSNLTWNLEHPTGARMRVAARPQARWRPLNFDANWRSSVRRSCPAMRKMPKRCVLWGMPWRMNTETRSWTS
ncbi:MAG: class I SAM-dependent methyltransferase [Bilophila wadsworthia]